MIRNYQRIVITAAVLAGVLAPAWGQDLLWIAEPAQAAEATEAAGSTEGAAEAGSTESTDASASMDSTEKESAGDESASHLEIYGLTYDHSMDLVKADQFAVDYYAGAATDTSSADDSGSWYKLITIETEDPYLLLPDGADVPEDLPEGVTAVYQPVDSIYLPATSGMDFFDALDSISAVKLSGLKRDGWYSEKARAAMDSGDMVFAGKYSAPDYELIVSNACDLAIESTMIYHKPEVMEMLQGFGIPVVVERSSYEEDPLGRSEWIRFYAALLNKESRAEELFGEMEEKTESVVSEVEKSDGDESERPTVAFFYINSNGMAIVRKTDDYVPKMISLAGGRYIFDSLGDDTRLSTVNMAMEEFYAGAKDADFIVYNSTIDGELNSLRTLLDKAPLLADFKAVKDGNVWCTTQSLFQQPTGLADLIVDLHTMLSGDASSAEMKYLYQVTD